MLACLISQAAALHLYLGPGGNQQCFYLDMTQGTVLAATHNAWEKEDHTNHWIRPDNLAVQITIHETFDNDHRVLFQKLNSQGDFVFTAFDSGQHRICYSALSGGWFNAKLVKMDIDFAVGDSESVDSKGEKKMSTLAERVSNINSKILTIRREQQLMREREASFRDQSERTNSRVARWSLIQVFVLGITCAWQLNHLRSFFVKQKLV